MADREQTSPRPARAGRLSRSADFQRVYRQGRSLANRELVLYVFESPSGAGTRLGLSVSRKVGGAVARNRLKRLLRECFTSIRPRLLGAHDLVIVARPPALELAEREGLAGLGSRLGELLEKARLLDEGSAQPPGATAPRRAAEAKP